MNPLKDKRLLLVGCGAMGSAMVRGWLEESASLKNLDIVTPDKKSVEGFLEDSRVRWHETSEELLHDSGSRPDFILFAVKPQILETVLPLYRPFKHPSLTFVTVAAGKSSAFYEDALGSDIALVRTMPNTPAAIGRGITLAFANAQVSPEVREEVHGLMEVLGRVMWLESNARLDAAAAVTSCGPGYIFRVVESLAAAAEAQGFSKEEAQWMARDLMVGSAAYLGGSEKPADALRREVTSKGGMTEAALKVFEEEGLDRIFTQAIMAAKKRAEGL